MQTLRKILTNGFARAGIVNFRHTSKVALGALTFASLLTLNQYRTPGLLTFQPSMAHNSDLDPYTRSRNNDKILGASNFTLLAGTSNPYLAESIARRLGVNLAQGSIKKFADGETAVSFNAKDVSGKHCYIV